MNVGVAVGAEDGSRSRRVLENLVVRRFVTGAVVRAVVPEEAAENYSAFSHWVVQFGVYAIGLTYDQ